jgi:hypothetical protein
MSDHPEIVEGMKRLVKAQQALIKELQGYTQAVMALSAGVHALADALAAAATDVREEPEAPEPAAVDDVPRYADGSPIGGG